MTHPPIELADLIGHHLGTQVVSFSDRDAILYAIAIGARADQLDLVYERDLRVIPTYACALGLWAVEAAGDSGAYDRTNSLHVGQTLRMHGPLRVGSVEMDGRVTDVWDKGRASVVMIEVSAESFTAGYTIFLPGVGDWGGERGPSTPGAEPLDPTWKGTVAIGPEAAVLYRLTGDRHPIHVDPEIAGALGFDGPILHGLATLGMAVRALAGGLGSHPADLRSLDARLMSPVRPGQELEIAAALGDPVGYEVRAGEAVALRGSATFA